MHEHFGYICNGCEFFLWALKIDYSCPRLDCGHNVITQNFCLTTSFYSCAKYCLRLSLSTGQISNRTQLLLVFL